MNDLEFQRELSRMTVRGGVVVVCALSVCALVAFLLWLYEEHRKETNRHAEAELAIMASQDIGQTAWARADVHKSQLLREQAAYIKRLEAWKAHTEENMRKLGHPEVCEHDV